MAPIAVAAPDGSPHFLWWGRKLRAANKGAGIIGAEMLQLAQRSGENQDREQLVLDSWVPLPITQMGSLNPSVLCTPLFQAPLWLHHPDGGFKQRGRKWVGLSSK